MEKTARGKTVTVAQRDYIDRLFKKAEYDPHSVTAQSRALLAKAHITANVGDHVNSIVSNLSRYHATELIKQLQHETDYQR